MILGQRIKASESSWPPHPVLLLVKSERFWLRRVLDPFKDPLAAAINLSGYGVYTRGFSLGTYAKCSATIPGLDVGITSLLHFFCDPLRDRARLGVAACFIVFPDVKVHALFPRVLLCGPVCG